MLVPNEWANSKTQMIVQFSKNIIYCWLAVTVQNAIVWCSRVGAPSRTTLREEKEPCEWNGCVCFVISSFASARDWHMIGSWIYDCLNFVWFTAFCHQSSRTNVIKIDRRRENYLKHKNWLVFCSAKSQKWNTTRIGEDFTFGWNESKLKLIAIISLAIHEYFSHVRQLRNVCVSVWTWFWQTDATQNTKNMQNNCEARQDEKR